MLRPRLSASLSECPPSPNVVFSRAAQVGQQLQHDLDNPTALTSLMHDNAGSNDADAASVASSQGSAVGLGLPTKQSARRALTSAFADAQPTAPTPQNQGAAVSVGSPPMGPRGPVGPAESTVTGRCLQSTPSRRLSVAPPGVTLLLVTLLLVRLFSITLLLVTLLTVVATLSACHCARSQMRTARSPSCTRLRGPLGGRPPPRCTRPPLQQPPPATTVRTVRRNPSQRQAARQMQQSRGWARCVWVLKWCFLCFLCFSLCCTMQPGYVQ